jgi:hypothetical protein
MSNPVSLVVYVVLVASPSVLALVIGFEVRLGIPLRVGAALALGKGVSIIGSDRKLVAVDGGMTNPVGFVVDIILIASPRMFGLIVGLEIGFGVPLRVSASGLLHESISVVSGNGELIAINSGVSDPVSFIVHVVLVTGPGVLRLIVRLKVRFAVPLGIGAVGDVVIKTLLVRELTKCSGGLFAFSFCWFSRFFSELLVRDVVKILLLFILELLNLDATFNRLRVRDVRLFAVVSLSGQNLRFRVDLSEPVIIFL